MCSTMFTIYKISKEQTNFQKKKNKEKTKTYMHFKVWQINIHNVMLQFDDENATTLHP